jgi:hypothetical protein
MTLTAGDPGLVTVSVDPDGIAVAVFGVRWDGPHTPVPDPRPLACLAWSDFRGSEAEAVVAAQLLIQAGIVIRRAAFRRCRSCKRNMPPEWLHAEDMCQGCAERELGVVH